MQKYCNFENILVTQLNSCLISIFKTSIKSACYSYFSFFYSNMKIFRNKSNVLCICYPSYGVLIFLISSKRLIVQDHSVIPF